MKYSSEFSRGTYKISVVGPVFRFIFALILSFTFPQCAKDDPSSQKQKNSTSASFSPSFTCQLRNPQGNGRGIGIGFPRNSLRIPSTGTVQVSVIFIDFPNAVGTNIPQDDFNAYITQTENFLSAISYGKISVHLVPTYKWFRMSKQFMEYNTTEYGGPNTNQYDSYKTYIQEALAIANPTVDFSGSHAFIIVGANGRTFDFAPRAFVGSTSDGLHADGETFYNGVTISIGSTLDKNDLVLAHELGHTLGLPDLYDLYRHSGEYKSFVGEFSIMGGASSNFRGSEMLGWERWLLGWIANEEVLCHPNAGTGIVKLLPIEQSGPGVKLLVIPTGVTATTAFVVESRRALGFDSQLPKSGPLVYFIDTGIQNGEGPIKVLPRNDSDLSKIQNIMSLNQTLTFNSVTIKFISTDSAGDVIQFTKN